MLRFRQGGFVKLPSDYEEEELYPRQKSKLLLTMAIEKQKPLQDILYLKNLTEQMQEPVEVVLPESKWTLVEKWHLRLN